VVVNAFFDIHWESVNKESEELCGDTVKVLRTERGAVLVLSDGLGSGVKANILATLTSEILATMLRHDILLNYVIETVVSTLPVCSVRHLAYATFTVVQVDEQTGGFRVSNFDNPPVMLFHRGKLAPLGGETVRIADRQIEVAEGKLEPGDFLAVISDGMLPAGGGPGLDQERDWTELARSLEGVLLRHPWGARQVVRAAMERLRSLSPHGVGDDATLLGAYLRERRALVVFTGPPLEREQDDMIAERVLSFAGRKVICGDTTAEIVGNYIGERVRTEDRAVASDLPAPGCLTGIDLVTEGILTMAKAVEYLRSDGEAAALDHGDAAQRLVAELTNADAITFIVGQTVNPYYQNPQLPKTVSIRHSLVEQMAQLLRTRQKRVYIEMC
jgi:hypothetical protein